MLKLSIIPILLFVYCSSTLANDHTEDQDHHHDSILHLGTIEIQGEMGSELLKTVPTATSLHGKDLLKKSQNSLGETLKNEPGVNSTQFGPAASRPVIRGQEGDRIRILQNGIGVLDASGISQDHAVPVAPLAAESVEIVRGPVNLLYGSSAIGGVVNIVTSRIHKRFFDGLYSSVDYKHETVNQGHNMAAKLDYGVGRTMLHVDGHYLKAENTNTPTGELINSEMEQHSLAAGVTYFTPKKDSIGISYSGFQNTYGVVSDPDVDINLKQSRVDLAGSYGLKGFFKSLNFKTAQNFYEHTELESGATGTIFKNSGNETRIELVQNNKGALSGILGLQGQALEFSALGSEAFLPTTDESTLALFVFEELSFKKLKLNGGLRGEFKQLKAEQGTILPTSIQKDFSTVSVAMGSIYSFSSNISSSINASLNQRTPNSQELFAKGPHLALGIYEQGDSSLKVEKSLALEWSLKVKAQKNSFQLSLFNQDFDNYISLLPTGVLDDNGTPGDSSDDEFEIHNFSGHRARLNGVEVQSNHWIHSNIYLKFVADYLYGQNLDTKTPLPRISPLRTGLTLGYLKNNFSSEIEWRNVAKQTRTAINETPTASYDLFNLNVNYNWNMTPETLLTLYLQANNLSNAKARNHVSVIKNKMLLPGRNFVFGARYTF